MPTRRGFFHASLGAAAVAALPPALATLARPNTTLPYLADKPLLRLQQEFVDLRFGMFIHFNLATFQDREWGDPKDAPSAFNPSNLDTEQWARAAKSARMTWGCLTTKHHDGFCIWPTSTGVASVKDTPHQTDVVKAHEGQDKADQGAAHRTAHQLRRDHAADLRWLGCALEPPHV